jgi:YebC/PmpR family DNA-binding regulatory protein
VRGDDPARARRGRRPADQLRLGLAGRGSRGGTRSGARCRRASRPTSTLEGEEPLHGVFIRAPWIEEVGPDVEVLAVWEGHPVLVRQGRVLLAAFHPELTEDTRVHALFLQAVREESSVRHSKWSSIKHKKGAADAKRGKLFSKLSRAIIVAAKEGGGDPTDNLALANAIEKARSYSMPKDNIERAIAKGSGRGADARAFETIVYEGYGPEGVAVIVEALTDNRNRTRSEVRHLFAKHGGNLGATGPSRGCSSGVGSCSLPADGVDEDELTLAAAEGGADDVSLDGSTFQVSADPTACPGALRARGSRFGGRVADLTMVPEDDGRGRRRERREKILRPDRPARGQRRRAGRLRELRHSGNESWRLSSPDDRRHAGARSRACPRSALDASARGFAQEPWVPPRRTTKCRTSTRTSTSLSGCSKRSPS